MENNRPSIHIVGLPHTIVSNKYSTCAFTGKVLRFSKMLSNYGWVIHEYSNEGSESNATYHHDILDTETFNNLKKVKNAEELYDDDITNNKELRETFWNRVYKLIKNNAKDGDIVCHVFGPSKQLVKAVPKCYHVESGIGYMGGDYKLAYRIFESNAWMHWHYGKHKESYGHNYHWVIPNYYDISEWQINLRPKDYILYFGRLVNSKGLATIVEMAKRMPDEKFIICGQGKPDKWIKQVNNIEYHPPVHGLKRSEILGNAKCSLMPTSFIEPFGGSGVESQLCGTPLIAINYGAFKETVEDGKTGYLCNTLADWIESVKHINRIDRKYVAERARGLWSLDVVGKQYDEVFKQLADQRNDGWYSFKSHKSLFNSVIKQ